MFLALSVFVAQDREVQMSIGLNLSLNWHLIFSSSLCSRVLVKSRNLHLQDMIKVPLFVNLVITTECGVITIEKDMSCHSDLINVKFAVTE